MSSSSTGGVPVVGIARAAARLVLAPARLVLTLPRLLAAPRGGEVVVVVPGRSTSDPFVRPLAWYLRTRGHDARTWGRGRNGGQREDVGKLHEAVADRASAAGRPVAVVGWSMGGTFARVVAARTPETVASVATLASPPVRRGTPTGDDRVRTLAVVTERDQVVDPSWQLKGLGPTVDVVRLEADHVDVLLDPRAWLAVARHLAP